MGGEADEDWEDESEEDISGDEQEMMKDWFLDFLTKKLIVINLFS